MLAKKITAQYNTVKYDMAVAALSLAPTNQQ